MEEKINKTVEVLCNAVERQEEAGEYGSVAELTNALAAIITAKANLKMYSRIHERGGTNQNTRNKDCPLTREQLKKDIDDLSCRLGKLLKEQIQAIDG